MPLPFYGRFILEWRLVFVFILEWNGDLLEWRLEELRKGHWWQVPIFFENPIIFKHFEFSLPHTWGWPFLDGNQRRIYRSHAWGSCSRYFIDLISMLNTDLYVILLCSWNLSTYGQKAIAKLNRKLYFQTLISQELLEFNVPKFNHM